ncbi:vegetative incompatibility protein HET-E-1 [Ilyonectria destructans]|nr:vegetative incompatibility protein HET-E-1 [Ilyonectria destructans]
MALEALGVIASLLAVVHSSAKVASLCFYYYRDVKNAKDDIDRLQREATNLKKASESVQLLLKGPNGAKLEASQELMVAAKDSLLQLRELEQVLSPGTARKAMSRVGLRALKWPFQNKDVEKIAQGLGRCTHAISLGLQVDNTAVLLEIDQNLLHVDKKLLKIDQKAVLDRLPVVVEASFDSRAEEHNPICLHDTRVDLLRQLSEWADDPRAEPIFWLNGMAGTGKSTISRTVARSFATTGRLGASFFFRRGEADRGSLSKFVTTVAAQLVSRVPAFAPHAKNAIDADTTIFGKAAQEQFKKLILEPLSRIPQDARKTATLVVVVDALDECERDDDVKLIINLFSRVKTLQSPRLRILVTSRPDLPIRLGFSAITGKYQDLVLHEMPEHIVEHDISAFLRHELAVIRSNYNNSVPKDRQLPTSWPGQSNIQILVQMAVPLFIFAATVCRFLADRRCGNPDKQLQEVLKYRTRSQESQLDATYLPVLNQLVVGLPIRQRENALQEFRVIVGSIVILASPLSTCALAQMLSVSKDTIDDRLDLLHSVLSIPPSSSSPVRLLHLSFRDFLVDAEKCGKNPFWVDEKYSHGKMAANCLRVMNERLRTDICDVNASGTSRLTLNPQKVDACLPPEVQYACLHWVYHLQHARDQVSDGGPVCDFLIRHFLHWMEALSLMGRASESLGIINALQSLLSPEASVKLSSLLSDATRFVLANISIIDKTPLQIYSSALAFAPEKSIIRYTFESEIPSWISLAPEAETDWNSCLQTLEGHSGPVRSVAFSQDSTLVASASDDRTVRIWRSDMGDCFQELKGHSGPVRSVAFSHDSALVASASNDQTVRIWRADTGECIKGHSDWVRSIAFSHDSALMASAPDNRTVRIWHADTGECIQELKGQSDWVRSIAFSHDSALIASASDDRIVRIWRVDSGDCVQELKAHSRSVRSIAFSHDSTLVALVSDDRTVRIWHTSTGDRIQELKGHSRLIRSIAFSHDSTLIASASDDRTVRIWRVDAGNCVQELKGHSRSVRSIAFSHDSTLVASGSDDRTVRIWRVDAGDCVQELKGHSRSVRSIASSHDSALVASASDDRTVRIWRADSGGCVQELKGHSGPVRSVAFSHDSALVASASRDKTVRIWHADTGDCVQELKGHSDWVKSVAFSHDSALVASASDDRTVRIWRTDGGDCVQELKGHTDRVRSIAFSHDSALVASGSDDQTVRIWRVDSGNFVQELKGHSRSVRSVAFSHDSTLVVSASDDRTIRIWRADTGDCVQELKGHGGWVRSIAFSRDSALVASASDDRTVRIWRTDAGDCVQTVHIGFVSHLSFEPGNTRLLTDLGPITVPKPLVAEESVASTPLVMPSHIRDCRFGFGITGDGCWVSWRGNNLLWLPVDFRPTCSRVLGSTIVIGCRSGRVIIVRFSIQELPDLQSN